MMKKRILAAVLTGSMIAAAIPGISAFAGNLTLATGGTSGAYYGCGGAMSTVLNDILENSSLTPVSTGASKANIQEIDDENADLAFVQNDVMYYAYTGTDLFEGEEPYESFSAVAGIYDETVQIVTTDPSIKSVADLAGKTVSVGDAGSGTEFNAKQILEVYGLSFDDIKVSNLGFQDTVDSIKDGKIDAGFIVAGAPTTAIVDLSTTQKVCLVSLDEEHIAKLQEQYSFYTTTDIPADTYGSDEDATTVSVRATLIASNELSEEDVYEITKAMFENQDKLAEAHAKFESLSLEDAVKGINVPFHAGAKKYYEEQGLTVE